MADELNNQENINKSKRSLDQFNDSLQESISLANSLSKMIQKLPESIGFSTNANKKLVQGLESYSKALSETSKIADKIRKGKASERDITAAVNNLEKKHSEYLKENASSFERGGRFLIKQREIKKELAKLQQDEINRQNKITSAQNNIEQILSKIADQEEKRLTNPTAQRRADKELKILKEKLKEEENTINFLEDQTKSSEKVLSAKIKEKKAVDDIIKSHKSLEGQYKKEIEEAKLLLEERKKQFSWGEAFKNLQDKTLDKIENMQKPMTIITAAFSFLKNLAFAISDQTTQLQKNLVLSQDEARGLRQDFNDMAISSGDVAVNTQRLVEANLALGKQLGFNSKFTTDLNVQFVKLTKQIGLSEEAAGGLAKLSIATGSTLEESKNIALGTSQALSAQYGIQLNQREVLEEIGKVSGQTLAMFKANPKAIAEAVAQAKLLGTTLETTQKQASSLLNFETSIENELQAELITGQQLNLERARTAALMGDQTTVMKELNSQNIDFNKFSNMNVIAQNKLADALGLSSDELSNQLLKQQYMNKSREEVAALAGEEVANRIEAINAQDRFNLAIEKMQDAIGKIVGGPLGKLVDMMAELASNSTFVYGTLMAIAGISLARTITSLVAMATTLATSAIAGTTLASVLTFGAIGLVAAGSIAMILGAMSSGTDQAISQAQSVGDMMSANGKTTVSTREGGLFSLSNNDEFAAAPGLGDMINRPSQTVVTQDNSALIEELRSLKAEMAGTKEGINRLNNKEGIVKINGQTAGTAQMMGNYNLA